MCNVEVGCPIFAASVAAKVGILDRGMSGGRWHGKDRHRSAGSQ